MTQDELARRVGCSKSAIRKIEADERRPSRQIAMILAECLEVQEDERPVFLRVARADLAADRLVSLSPPVVHIYSQQTAPSIAGLPRSAASAPARSGRAGAAKPFPIPNTPLVGREHELAEIHVLLTDPRCRLLTFTGPGGIGKTRLAIQSASQLTSTTPEIFPDGVYFVPLAPVKPAESIPATIAESLGFDFYGSADPKVQLLDYLRGKRLLLVLDNMEHLLAGAGMITDILHHTPDVKVLVTSIERLNLHGEWVFEIQGLPVPPSGQMYRREDFSASTLFEQSARRVSPDFTLVDQDLDAVTRICHLMEGMPLGIELAAAWVRVLSCQEIAAEIEQDLDFLATTLRDVPERHRSLRAVFDHTWKLLTTEESRVLRILSIFNGGFRREAAETIAGANLMLLSTLVDKSLLRRVTDGRYDLHDMLHQYATEKLQQIPEEQAYVAERHSDYFLSLLHRLQDRFLSSRAAIEEVRAEMENVRAAWKWAIAQKQIELLSHGARGLGSFYRLTGLFRDGELAFEAAVEPTRSALDPMKPTSKDKNQALGGLLAIYAGFLNERAKFDQAIQAAQEAVALTRDGGDPYSEVKGYLEWGYALWRRVDYPSARKQLERALALARAAQLRLLEADSLRVLGLVSFHEYKLAEATAQFNQSLLLCREIGDRHGESAVLNRIGSIFYYQGDYPKARQYFENALRLFKETGDRRGEGRGLNNLGVLYQGQGDNASARSYYEQSLLIIRESGDRWGESASLVNLGMASHRLGDLGSARSYYEQAVQMCRDIGEWGGEAGGLSNLGLLAHHRGDDETAQTYQEQALQIARDHDNRLMQASILNRLGRVLFSQGDSTQAAEAYRQAMDLYKELDRQSLTIEPLAGLVNLHLAQGELGEARASIEAILSILSRRDSNIFDNTDDPYWVYLTCFHGLRANQDPGALDVLAQAYLSLQEQVRKIPSDEQRRAFLENIPAQREVMRLWAEYRPS